MLTLLSVATSLPVLLVVAFVVGGLVWPVILDKVTGVPSSFRSAMSSLEAKAKADVEAAIADIFAKINPAPVAPVVPPAPPAPAP